MQRFQRVGQVRPHRKSTPHALFDGRPHRNAARYSTRSFTDGQRDQHNNRVHRIWASSMRAGVAGSWINPDDWRSETKRMKWWRLVTLTASIGLLGSMASCSAHISFKDEIAFRAYVAQLNLTAGSLDQAATKLVAEGFSCPPSRVLPVTCIRRGGTWMCGEVHEIHLVPRGVSDAEFEVVSDLRIHCL